MGSSTESEPAPSGADARDDPPALFRVFPELQERMPWRALPGRAVPTPVERLRGQKGELWVKRDDLSSNLYGGNKTRKLEFILADAIARNRDPVVTFGGIGTNHGVATAVFCRELGLGCRVLLFDQPVTDTVRRNLLLMHAFGASLEYTASLPRTLLRYYGRERLRRPGAYFLFAGGSNVLGCAAFVSAALELKAQIDRGELDEPAEIVCPAGSTATLAGLTLGCALAGLDTTVTGVRVSPARVGPFPACTEATVASLMERTRRYLRSLTDALPAALPPRPRLDERYFGEGYGVPTRAGKEAMKALPADSGLVLEPTYTAKTFAAVLDAGRRRTGPVLYWHTYNGADTSQHLAGIDGSSLPRALQWVLEDGARA